MSFIKNISIFFGLLLSMSLYSQKDSTAIKDINIKETFVQEGLYEPLKPAKAAFYAAILPGMGQIYNKKYWKAPIVWAALAIPTYYYQINNSQYKRYRTAYRLRKAGFQDEFTYNSGNTNVSLETLERAQRQLKENRDMSLLSGVILYILQIVEASVNAHLLQFNTDDNLSFKPTILQNPIRLDAPKVGLTIKYTF
ncbi:DUF5683 domain-containing protein [Polaribacter tangerinus]|uniref:DUF5683 domain-containing protein n=1 Tax=Polaribacter tangerinus TaxID=1920034 RepID=UPI001E300394|nr:DUF5683 domain-containing protein [Polaribacter tangerinus]